MSITTPGTGFEVLPCPTKLPHDLQVSQKLARWFGPPYNSWYVGSIAEVNKRRTKMENVPVEFKDDTYGVTRGTFVAEPGTSTGVSKGACMMVAGNALYRRAGGRAGCGVAHAGALVP